MTTPDGITIINVDESRVPEFLEYTAVHGPEHDDSYTTPDELARFDHSAEPAVLALDADGRVVGAASAMLAGYLHHGDARLRILHAADPELSTALLDRLIARLPDAVRRVFLFLPDTELLTAEALQLAGFVESRRVYIVRHSDPRHAEQPQLPGGTRLAPAYPTEAVRWAHTVNAAFRAEPGRPDMEPDRARELLARQRVIREGTHIAWRDDIPVGAVMTVGVPDDPYGAEIETLAVIPADQGIGLGRALLRTALSAAGHDGRTHVTLSVSTTNRRALALYLDAGFTVEAAFICWQLDR